MPSGNPNMSRGNYSSAYSGGTVGGATGRTMNQTREGGNAQSGGKMGAASSQTGGVRTGPSSPATGRAQTGGSGVSAGGGYAGPKGTPTGGLNAAARSASSVVGRSKTGGSGNALSAGIASGKMQSTQSPLGNRLGGSTGRITSGNALAGPLTSRPSAPAPKGPTQYGRGTAYPANASYLETFADPKDPNGAFGKGRSFNLDPRFAKAMVKATQAGIKSGQVTNPYDNFINEATRSAAIQKGYWDESKQGRLYAAAPPNASNHQFGTAIDMNDVGVPGTMGNFIRSNRSQFGLATVPKDLPHIQLAGAGAMRKSGKLANLGNTPAPGIYEGGVAGPAPVRTASINPPSTLSRNAPAPSGTLQPASPHLTSPPVPQRNPMRTNIPVPQRASIAGRIAAQGVPTPELAQRPPSLASSMTAERPKPYDERAIPYGDDRTYPTSNVAMKGNPPSVQREPNPMTSSTPATMVDYNRVIDALERDLARQKPRGPSAPNADTIARAYSDDARVNERRYDAPDLAFRALNAPSAPQQLSAPQLSPDRRQELASRRLPSQPLLNTRSATAVEGWQPQNFTPPQMPSRPMVGVDSLPPSLNKKDQEQVPGVTTGIGRPIDVADLLGMGFDPRMGTDAVIDGLPAPSPIPDQVQPQSPAEWSPSMEAIRAMSERWKTAPPAPPAHEIQQPGQVPGMPSQIADNRPLPGSDEAIDTGLDTYEQNRGKLAMGADINQPRLDTLTNPLASREFGRSPGESGSAALNALASQIVAADPSQAQNLENPLWWVWLQQMMQQRGAVA